MLQVAKKEDETGFYESEEEETGGYNSSDNNENYSTENDGLDGYDYMSDKALDLGRGANPRSYMVEEIWQELAKAKYLEWDHESSRRSWDLKNLK